MTPTGSVVAPDVGASGKSRPRAAAATRRVTGIRMRASLGMVLGFAGLAGAAESPPARPALPPLLVTPKDRVLLQRGFVPVNGALRLYACVVGTPAGVHYAYDFESGALLSVWRGPFVDMVEIWGARARNHTAMPAGTETPLSSRPLLAFFPNRMMTAYPKTWPAQPEELYAGRGYELEADGQPVFLARCENLTVRDRIAPVDGGNALQRRLEFSGQLSPWETWVLLAEADHIEAAARGRTWKASDPSWTIEFPPDSSHRPAVRTEGGRALLVLRLTAANLATPVTYSIHW
jgi:hypothetical protein